MVAASNLLQHKMCRFPTQQLFLCAARLRVLFGNLPSGSITMMPVQLSGIVRVTNQEPTHDGYDAETDEAYYQRFLIRVQTPPTSGNVYHYLSWALEVAGVGAAQVYPLGHGDNTVDVVIIDAEVCPGKYRSGCSCAETY